jgi:DNA-binding GntR family transcriptional regulator
MHTSDLPLLSRPNISDVVYDTLKAKIFSRHFAPGERLNLAELEQQMGVSRTPLKDAVNRLVIEGLIQVEPRKGTFVSNPTPREIAESFDVRRALELYAVKLAAERVSEDQLCQLRDRVEELRRMVDFEDWSRIYQDYVHLDHQLHRLIVEIAGNKRLIDIWEQINLHVHMARIRYGSAENELDVAQQEHESILEALEDRDAATLEQAMFRHLERAKQSVLKDLHGCEL